MKKFHFLLILFLYTLTTYAAIPIDLRHKPAAFLQSFSVAETHLQYEKPSTDFNQTTHTRMKQMYKGYSVWGGDAVLHVSQQKKSTLNGTLYQNINADLQNTPSYVFNEAQANKAVQKALQFYAEKSGVKPIARDIKKQLIVFIDDQNRAHWSYLISFYVQQKTLEKPTYILDAISFLLYKEWNDLATDTLPYGGGYGGNTKTAKIILPSFPIQRDANKKICYMDASASHVTVKNITSGELINYKCKTLDSIHQVFWNGEQDAVNGGYSPSNDAMMGGLQVINLYKTWYNVPVLTDPQTGKQINLNMFVHANMENAYFDQQNNMMVFGDGGEIFYPLTSIGITAHEISHGFTSQHSQLIYNGQSGALNESFSDMASKAAEFFTTNKNNWEIGSEITKQSNTALRYMDDPLRDCLNLPADTMCSIDNAKKYYPTIEVHYSSGVFNKAFYLLSISPNWNLRKAFNVMVQANMRYWTPNTTFIEAACGTIDAARDYGYDISSVITVMQQVGIDTQGC